MPQLAKRIEGLINQVEQGNLSSIDYDKENTLLTLDLIKIGKEFASDMVEDQIEADNDIPL